MVVLSYLIVTLCLVIKVQCLAWFGIYFAKMVLEFYSHEFILFLAADAKFTTCSCFQVETMTLMLMI